MNMFLVIGAASFGILATRGFLAGLRREVNQKPNLTEWFISSLVGIFVAAMVFSLLRG